jgi:hypothetical protein
MLNLSQPVAVLLEAITAGQAAWLWDKPRTEQECEKEKARCNPNLNPGLCLAVSSAADNV